MAPSPPSPCAAESRPTGCRRKTWSGLAALLAEANGKPEILVLMLRGTGKYFCSGYDIGSIGGDRRIDFAAVVDAVEQARPVCIAVLHGSVYGGATDLALACDFRLGAEGIDMFMPAARLGMHYYRSGLERLSLASVWTTPNVCS